MTKNLPLFVLALTGLTFEIPAGSAGHHPLEQLAWLVGGTWIAETTTPDGNTATVEATYRWADHRQAIQYTLLRRSAGKVQPALEGICGWHPVKKQLVLWEMDAKGSLTEGTVTVKEGGQHHEEVIYGADGSTLPVRAEITRDGDDSFLFRALVEKDGEWTEVFRSTYRRAAR